MTVITMQELFHSHFPFQPISSESAACRSGITHYVIYYTPAGSASSHPVRVYGVTSYILGDLETFLDYTIQITASNEDEESDKSNEIIGKTLEEGIVFNKSFETQYSSYCNT